MVVYSVLITVTYRSTSAMLPLLFFAVGLGTAMIALHIDAHHLAIRSILTALGCLCSAEMLHSLTTLSSNRAMLSNFGLMTVLGTTHIVTLLLVERYELPSLKNERFRVEFWGAFRMLLNPRYVGTPREVPHLDRRPLYLHHSPWWPFSPRIKISPRWASVLSHLTSLIIIYGAQHLLDHYCSGLPLSDFHPRKKYLLRRLNDVTGREIGIRAALAVAHFFTAWAHLNICHSALAALFIGVGIDTPDTWPPLFGPIADAYSLRRFWSRFWHQIAYRPYVGLARLAVDNTLRLRRDTVAYKTLVMFLVFSLSGASHAIVAASSGVRCGYWADIHIMLLEFCGIVIEEVLAFVLVFSGCDRFLSSRKTRMCCGFIWVFLFRFWSLPKLYFPQLKWDCLPVGNNVVYLN
jgi:hypothetical protein